jgi:D-alanyl-D-alanine carboxypeptidase
MLGRYPGADGMKTGYTCPAGFNLVASATREGRKVIVVVLGDPSARRRTAHAANLFDHAFAAGQLGDTAIDLPSQAGAPPDMRAEICVHRSRAAQLEAETEESIGSVPTPDGSAPQLSNGEIIAALPRPIYEPIEVFVGPAPGYNGPVAGPRPANTPIGAIAYASPEKPATASPLRPDPAALSLRRGKASQHPAAKSEKAAKAQKKPAGAKPAAAALKGKAAEK